MTHRNETDTKNIKFTSSKASEIVKELKSIKKNIWICGGANIINQFIDLDLIDEYSISIIPVILGSVKFLFKKGEEKRLVLSETREYNGIVYLVYQRVKH